MKKSLAFTYGLVKQAHHQKKVYCEVKNSKQTVLYLKALRDNSMIYGYSLIPGTNRVLVYLRYYRNRPAIKTIKLYSKPGHKRTVTKNNIFTILNRTNPGNVLLVGTSRTSTLEQLYLFKGGKHYQYANKHFGELMSMVW